MIHHYYFILSLMFLCVGVYSFTYYSTYGSDVCTSVSTSSTSASNSTNSTTAAASTATSSASGSTASTSSAPTTTTIAYVAAIMYLVDFVFAFLAFAGLVFFAQKIPKDFGKMGLILRLLGCIVKLFLKIVSLVHLILFFLVLGMIAMVMTGTGKTCTHTGSTGIVSVGDSYEKGVVLALVLAIFWFLIHIGAAIIKSLIYIDPFLFEP